MSSASETAPADQQEPQAPEPVLLQEPAEGVPDVVESERELDDVARAVAAGQGPVAIDAERASGYRYGQRAYLVQLRREGSGTFLIDPIGVPDLTPVAEAIGGAEWILHAATQDLVCLAEVGLRPRQLFDTELAARILGLPRVGLAAVVEHYLGLRLAKEHSAVDWSTRPLPDPWLRYAALDVEVLGELRNLMGVDLASQGKDEWARQEFAALLTWSPTERVDPWRRTSGINTLRSRQAVGIVRELWYARDAIARERDTSVGRVLPDAALVDIAKATPRTTADLPSGHRAIARYGRQWVEAVQRAMALPETELPPRSLPSDGPPPARSWPDKDPVAAERLAATRAALTAFSQERSIPVENVCSPDPLRRVVWSPPAQRDVEGFTAALAALGVRRWQADIVAPLLVGAFDAHPDA
ncbi:HRDC domain-containing protein [Nostocoides sp. Soil756]|jgi:ribonuclease D|uniref:HRDC domain-containing protein n=1 Tax=Nostocoides sp. Soil756 TaxID=1736399 RepID=UPI000701D2BC|nr:HRDC domain-containing protein [Tetrasphaera sp. Soil756]KRE62959.1 3'-5' exonuclease [Tetrasphaera sp. Soil756]